jgi:hypothetical protein
MSSCCVPPPSGVLVAVHSSQWLEPLGQLADMSTFGVAVRPRDVSVGCPSRRTQSVPRSVDPAGWPVTSAPRLSSSCTPGSTFLMALAARVATCGWSTGA